MNRLINHGQAKRSTLISFRGIHFIFTSRSPRICELYGETVFVKLNWADSCEAGELLTRCVDHVEIAIGTVVPSQSDIGARRLCVGSVNLKNRRKGEEPGKCVVGLQGAEHNREITVGNRQPKTIPLRPNTEREMFVRAIASAYAELVQSSIVVTPETLEKPYIQSTVLRSAIGELVPGPVVNTDWNVDVLVDVKGQREALSKHVNDVVVRVRAVVKISPKGGLPFLCLDNAARIRSMEDETLELHFPDTCQFRPSLESGVGKIADTVSALKKPNLWVEVGADLPVFRFKVEPVGTEVQSGPQIGLPAGITRGAGLSSVSVQNEILEENKSAIHARGLIEAGGRIPGSLADSHHSHV